MKTPLIIAGMFFFSFSVISCDKLEKVKEKLSQNDSGQVNPFSVNSGM